MFLRVHVFHEQMDMAERHPGVIGGSQLTESRCESEYGKSECISELHGTSTVSKK
jgi:hypothetical protein